MTSSSVSNFEMAQTGENLFLHDLHVLLHTREDSRLDEVTFLAMAIATSLNLGTSILASLDVVHDAVKLQLADLRTLEGVAGEWVTNNVLCGAALEGLDKLVVDARLDVNARAGTAALAVVEENTKVHPRDGILDVGIVEDNVGALAAQLKSDLLEVGLGSSLEDSTASDSRAGESNLVNVHVGSDSSTGSLAEAGDDIDDTSGNASLLNESSSIQTGERCLFSSLQDNSVAGGESGTNLPSPHEEREVPGNDLTANTYGLVAGVVEGLVVSVNGL